MHKYCLICKELNFWTSYSEYVIVCKNCNAKHVERNVSRADLLQEVQWLSSNVCNPMVCRTCGADFGVGGAIMVCPNKECPDGTKRITTTISRKDLQFTVDGLSKILALSIS